MKVNNMLQFMLAAYWNERHVTIDKCTNDAVNFFIKLSTIDSTLSEWYERGRSRKDATKRKVNTIDSDEMKNIFLKGRNRRDIGKDVIEELGFGLSFWNGASEESHECSISIHCGSYHKNVGNNVIIEFPYQSEENVWIKHANVILHYIVEIWKPKWAGIMSHRAMQDRDFTPAHPFVDWMVYVPWFVEQVPSPGRVEQVNKLGSIIVVQPDPTTCENQEEFLRIQKIKDILMKSSL